MLLTKLIRVGDLQHNTCGQLVITVDNKIGTKNVPIDTLSDAFDVREIALLKQER